MKKFLRFEKQIDLSVVPTQKLSARLSRVDLMGSKTSWHKIQSKGGTKTIRLRTAHKKAPPKGRGRERGGGCAQGYRKGHRLHN